MLNWNLFWFLWAWWVAGDIIYGYFLHELLFKEKHNWGTIVSTAIIGYPFLIGVVLYFAKLYGY